MTGVQTCALPICILTMDIIVNNKVDAMIGMDDITPYDFMR